MDRQALDFYLTLFEDLDPEAFRRRFLSALLAVQHVERGSIWVRRGETIVCIEAMGDQSECIKDMELALDKPSVAGWVISNGRMTVAEPGVDPRHFKDAEAALSRKSTLILCFPLILKNGEVFGAVELIDTSARGVRLNLRDDYLELLSALVAVGSVALSNALDYRARVRENAGLRHALRGVWEDKRIVGQSAAILPVLKTAANYAKTDFPVLITGESGTGKELLALELHRSSARAAKPFLVQNCGAIPDNLLESELFGYRKGAFSGADKDKLGLFEAADGGTVFLDEIGDMPLGLQAKILRVLQNGEIRPLGATASKNVDVRVVSATNRNLHKAIADGGFREDLFYRLNVLPLHLPPLRERARDIPLLLDYFIGRECPRIGRAPKTIAAGAMARLTEHSWKGNIRELENLVKYLITVVEGESIEERDLPEHIFGISAGSGCSAESAGPAGPAGQGGLGAPGELGKMAYEDMQRSYFTALLEQCRWNVSKAAGLAGLHRSTFDSKLKKLGIGKG